MTAERPSQREAPHRSKLAAEERVRKKRPRALNSRARGLNCG